MTIRILLFVRTNTNQQLGEKWTSDINVQLNNATKVDTEHYAQTKARLEGPPPANA